MPIRVCHLLDNVRSGVGVTEVVHCLMTDDRVPSAGILVGTGEVDPRFAQAVRDGSVTEARSPIEMARALLRHRADGCRILHVHSRKSVWLCLLARTIGCAVVRTQHFGTTDAARAGRLRDLSRRARNVLSLRSGWIDHWVAVSETSRRYLTARWGVPAGRCSVIPNGIDADRFAPLPPEERARVRLAAGWRPDDTVIVSVGALVARKRHAALVEAFALIAPDAPDARLAIVGEGSARGLLSARIAELGLDGRVELLGLRRDVPALLGASDIYVHAAADEAFGLAVVEAMATGLPAIAVAGRGPAEIVEDGSTGHVVPGRDAAAMAAAMRALVATPDLRCAMGVRAREVALARFNRALMRDAYRTLYMRLRPVQAPKS